MKRFLFGVVIALAFALTGCGQNYVMDAAKVSASLALLDVQYEQTAATVSANMGQFSQAEQMQLRAADKQFRALQQAATDLISSSGGLSQALIHADQVRMLFLRAQSSYQMVLTVFCPDAIPGQLISATNCKHLADMPPHDRMALLSFDRQARQAYELVTSLMTSPDGTDITQAVSDALTLGASAARLIQIGAML